MLTRVGMIVESMTSRVRVVGIITSNLIGSEIADKKVFMS